MFGSEIVHMSVSLSLLALLKVLLLDLPPSDLGHLCWSVIDLPLSLLVAALDLHPGLASDLSEGLLLDELLVSLD